MSNGRTKSELVDAPLSALPAYAAGWATHLASDTSRDEASNANDLRLHSVSVATGQLCPVMLHSGKLGDLAVTYMQAKPTVTVALMSN
jgi:hypothetical protein